MDKEHLDVLIVGAGISGIGAAYHLQERCPGKRYAILEARERLGGTWDLFRYPGIRSDSDMYTLGFSFRPWQNPKAIADGPSILAYVRETAEAYGIDRHIRYGHEVRAARFSSADARWTVEVLDRATGATRELSCGFLLLCAGYYDYEQGHSPVFEGQEDFAGRIVHPQRWTDDIEHAGKRVIVIGSGATAITLVPSLAKTASHVTMLQRTPTYVASGPEQDRIANWLRGVLPAMTAYELVRWKNVLLGMLFYQYTRRFPRHAKRFLVQKVREAVGEGFDVETHFSPSYDPWDQRLCLVPDGDLFEAIRDGRVDVVTDHVERFTTTGIRLRSGRELEADLVVTATGLQLKLFGGMSLEVDGRSIEPAETMTYKGMMLSGVPNFAFAIGYTNASWTLKVDLVAEHVCRLLNHMDEHKLDLCTPRRDPTVEEEPLIGFASGYIQRSIHLFPRAGSRAPWRLYQNYVLDRLALRRGPVTHPALELARSRARTTRVADPVLATP